MLCEYLQEIRVLIKGGGDLASGVAYRLKKSGFPVAMSELAQPLVVRRTVAFAEAVHCGEWEVEGIKARYVRDEKEFNRSLQAGEIPVFTAGSYSDFKEYYSPRVIVDARMMKKPNDTYIDEAPIVIGLGPGFTAGIDTDAVIETARGHYLGRVINSGSAIANTGVPGEVMGYTRERVVYAPCAGEFRSERKIGDLIEAGKVFGTVNEIEVRAAISGVIRGQIRPGIQVKKGMKIGDIDPRSKREYCFQISDKALAIGGGVLEAILSMCSGKKS